MSFPIINIQNGWSICKADHQVPIWSVSNLAQLLEQSLMRSQESAAFFPFPKKGFKALRGGFLQLSQDKQMVLRGGTSLQERLWFSKSFIVSEPCECPAGADSSENQPGPRPVSLGVPAVNHNRERRATWFKEPRNGKGSAGLPGSTPHLAGEELSPERTSDLSKVTQLDGGRFDTDHLASLSLKMHGPQAGQDVTERHMGMLVQPWHAS